MGRELQLAVAQRALAHVRERRGGLLLVSGERGIGKSHLACVISRSASDLAGAFVSADRTRPHVQGDRRRSRPHEIRAATRAHAGVLLRGVGEASTWFEQTVAAATHRRSPVLLVLDDVHTVDSTTLTTLAASIPRLADLPLLLVLTARLGAGESELDHHWTRWETLDSALHLALEPLTVPMTRHLARLWAASAPEQALERIVRASGGIPGLLAELSAWRPPAADRDGAQRGLPEIGPRRAVPGGSTLAFQRARAHDRDGVLTALAVLDVATCEDLAEFARLPVASASAAVGAAIRTGVLQPHRPDSSEVTFAHRLFREAVLADVPAVRRRQLRRRAGEVLSARLGREPTGLDVDVASHLVAAGVTDSLVALHCLRAADWLISQKRPAEASAWAVAGIRYRPDPALTCRLRRAAGIALAACGDRSQAVVELDRALQSATRLSDGDLLAELVLDIVTGLGAATDVLPCLTRHLEDALLRFPPHDRGLSARLRALTAEWGVPAVPRGQRMAVAVEACRVALSTGDPTVLLDSAAALARLATPADVMELARVGARIRQFPGPPGLAALPPLLAAAAARGRRDALALLREEFAAREAAHPSPGTRQWLYVLGAGLALLDGDAAAYEEGLRDAADRRAGVGAPGPGPVHPSAPPLLWALVTAEEWPATDHPRPWLTETDHPLAEVPQLLVRAEGGDVEAARRMLEALDGAAVPHGRGGTVPPALIGALEARAVALAGDVDRCAAVVHRYERNRDCFALVPPTLPVAPIGWLLAEPLALLGRSAEGEEANAQALAASRSARSQGWQVRCMLQSALLRTEAGDLVTAAVTCTQALELAQEAGLATLAARAEKVLMTLLAHPARPAAPTSSPNERATDRHPGLAPQAEELLNLVRAGKTNVEIAGVLGCSIPTVERRLGKLYRDLGVRNRAQLVAVLFS